MHRGMTFYPQRRRSCSGAGSGLAVDLSKCNNVDNATHRENGFHFFEISAQLALSAVMADLENATRSSTSLRVPGASNKSGNDFTAMAPKQYKASSRHSAIM